MDDAAIHRVSGDVGGNCGLLTFPLSLFTLQSSLFHLLVHSGSPRAFSPRDDKVILKSRDLRGLQWLLRHCTGMGADPSGYLAGIL